MDIDGATQGDLDSSLAMLIMPPACLCLLDAVFATTAKNFLYECAGHLDAFEVESMSARTR